MSEEIKIRERRMKIEKGEGKEEGRKCVLCS